MTSQLPREFRANVCLTDNLSRPPSIDQNFLTVFFIVSINDLAFAQTSRRPRDAQSHPCGHIDVAENNLARELRAAQQSLLRTLAVGHARKTGRFAVSSASFPAHCPIIFTIAT